MHINHWRLPEQATDEVLIKGDMPGDQVHIHSGHLIKAQQLVKPLIERFEHLGEKIVVSVHGGSGVGKSEIGSLIAHYLNYNGVGTYVLSGDNYPRRIPELNDAERLRVFREWGLKALVESGLYSSQVQEQLWMLQTDDLDSDPNQCDPYTFLEVYQSGGKKGLNAYLGTPVEIDFEYMNHIIRDFKSGEEDLYLKRMGRTEKEIWYDQVHFSNIQVLVIEWTHGNSPFLKGVDLPILLNSTPEETLAHRRSRNRDGGVDSPFIGMVLALEQEKLHQQAKTAQLILSKEGVLLSYDQYLDEMSRYFKAVSYAH